MKKNLLLSFAAAALLTACGTTESKLGMGARLQDLPQPAQASVQQQIGGAQILDIDKERRSGRDVYEVTYQGNNGVKEKLHVAADGTILSQREAGARGLMHEAAGASNSSQPQSSSTHYEQRGELNTQSGGEFRGASAQRDNLAPSASSQVDVSTSPAGASGAYGSTSGVGQSSINAQQHDVNANADINADKSGASFQAGTSSGASVEANTTSSSTSIDTSADQSAELNSRDRIEAKKEVRGGAEGLLQKGSLEPSEANEPAGAETQFKSDTSSSSTTSSSTEPAGAEVKATTTEDRQGTEAGETHVMFSDLPEAVKTTLQQHGSEAQIKEIDKKTKDGRTVYEVEFKDSSKHDICIAEDGTMIENKDKK